MNIKKIILRFAPSPTGPLHIGNIKILLYNYILYKKYKGKFYLRIDDTNIKKSKNIYIKYIFNTFKWLLNINIKKSNIIVFKQSNRLNIYKKYINILLKNKYAYYAYDTKKEIKNIKKKYKYKKKIFNYNYKTRKLMNNTYNTKYKKKKKYVIRFNNIPNKNIKIYDLIYGKIIYKTNYIDDIILFKSNGYPTYHFANVIDDYKFNINCVIRGKEWLSTTILHVLLYKAFKWKIPYFLHVSSLINPLNVKKKISKSNIIDKKIPILPIKFRKYLNFKKIGILPLSIFNYIFNNSNNLLSFKKIIYFFNIKKIKKKNIIYNYNKLLFFNKLIIRNLNFNKLYRIFIFLLKKYKIISIFNYKNIYLKKILYLIKNRLFTYKDLLYESIFFFKKPKITFIKKNIKKKYFYIINNIIYLLKINKLKNIFIFKNIIYIKILRFLITGRKSGINLRIIFNNMSIINIKKRILYLKNFF
ncbi:MAG: glutamate--tRNA ligase [Candidatus Shikimatogenerans sp. Tduv]|uniref:Glutamate--tRNA ligase family protein n=1 Tax=Candidatus Shikimatogenerans sp. Tduv TaxID=3158567 RepID=A0AAU7QQY2_9FLAO